MAENNSTQKKAPNPTLKLLKPTIILCIICAVVSGLLVVAYNLTYVDTCGIMTSKLEKAAKTLYPNGVFNMLTTTDSEGKKVSLSFGNCTNIVVEENSGDFLLEVVADGYDKKGIDIFVAISENAEIKGVAPITITDMPGGAKVSKEDFLANFFGLKSAEEVAKVDAITATTMSSNGMKTAVQEALSVFNEHKEEFSK